MKRSQIVVLLIGLAACSSDSSAPAIPTFDGSWSLQTINSFPLPYAISDLNGVRTDLLSETMTITGGAVQRTQAVRTTTGGVATEQQYSGTGTYRYDNRHIIAYTGEVEAWFTGDQNTITLHWYGMTWVYQRK